MYQIAIIAFEGISLFHLSVPVAIFKDAIGESALFNITICAEQIGTLKTADGTKIQIEHDLSILEDADILIFPSWHPNQAPSDPLLELTQKASHQGKIIVGLCLGAYVLGYCGLLNHKNATTHWHYIDDFTSRFPNINLNSNALYIRQENILTSAGSAAAIDCCLNLVKHLVGFQQANQVARMMVSAPQRNGGQNQFIKHPVKQNTQDERLNHVISQITKNLNFPHTLATAASNASMSERSFTRHFKKSMGTNFIQWLTQQRLHLSLELLESTSFSITQVAFEAGFSSEQNFRKHFKHAFDTTPNAWRKLFHK